MFRNNIKTAIRNLLKNKGFTFLNIFGLALGLAICLLIVFYVVDELSYDRYNTKADRIYRVNSDTKFGSAASFRAITAPAVAAALVNNFPEVEKAVRLLRNDERIKKGGEIVHESRMAYSDPDIFDVFTLPMIEGDPNTALKEPNSVVITESTAKKYFNSVRVVGQTLAFVGDSNRTILHKITGVIRDIPSQSHFNFDFLLSMTGVRISNNNNFGALFPFTTYLLLKPGADYKKLEAQLPAFMQRSLSNQQWDMDAFGKSGNYYRLNLTPLTDIHLQSNRTDELGKNGNIQYIRIFSAAALFILLIACINFMNLSTARSSDRAREVGVRKVLGSTRKSLVTQFLFESIIVTLTATLLAVLAAWALLPLFNHLSGKDTGISLGTVPWLLPCLLAIVIVVGLLAGSYPAFFLSAFRPIDVLKGKLATGFKGGGLWLGLFGLAAYAAEQRKKELGIRKVLGASVSALVGMLSKDFLKLVGVAILIASPIAWFLMQKWLQDFAYRVDVHWWVLAVAGFTAFLIAFITISYQSIKAAHTNPIDSLRAE